MGGYIYTPSGTVIGDATLTETMMDAITNTDGSIDYADSQHTHLGISGATQTGPLETGDRGPANWLQASNTFERELSFPAAEIRWITVNGLNWPWDDIEFTYNAVDESKIDAFLLRRTQDLTNRATRDAIVQWRYGTAEEDFTDNVTTEAEVAILTESAFKLYTET